MTRRSSNRAIAQGDQDRSGVGFHSASKGTVRRALAQWTTAKLTAFLPKAKSSVWREAAAAELMSRFDTERKLKALTESQT